MFSQSGSSPLFWIWAVTQKTLLLGVDGGGTHCRVRLSDLSGKVLGEGVSGPANLRLGIRQSFSAMFAAIDHCLFQAELEREDLHHTIACVALAGASEPRHLSAAYGHGHPFHKMIITTDAHAACIGAHGESDGGIVIAGTGTVGWAIVNGQSHRVGGWGLPVSDEGSGSWLGLEVLRRVLWAADGRTPWTPLLRELFARFAEDAHAIVDWVATATPGDLGAFARTVADHAVIGDEAAVGLMQLAAGRIDELAARLVALGADRIAIMGGLGPSLRPWLCAETKSHIVEPQRDALHGALMLAKSAMESVAA
jgi:glucosamine kinase